mmetsp:Transcript_103118/g.272883  ORF Transcript_103118/g.272883 Transcript_103118/m.272883 type:complete len:473 (+) Transcript_103118:988-2406(+)
MFSMSCFTFAKASSCTAVASVENCARGPVANRAAAATAPVPALWEFHSDMRSEVSKAGDCAARRRMEAAPRRLALASDEDTVPSCKRATVLVKCSLLSYSVRMLMVSATAVVSAERVLLRCSHCESKSLQDNFKVRKNSTSSERCCRVKPKSSFASESAFWLFACSTSISSSFFFPASISELLAAASALKSSTAFNSSSCDVLSSSSNSLCICCKTPKIPEDLAEERDSKMGWREPRCKNWDAPLASDEPAASATTRAANFTGNEVETASPCTFNACKSAALCWSGCSSCKRASVDRPRRSIRPATSMSYLRAASRSKMRMPESKDASSWSMLLAPWCFESTVTAFLRFVTHWTMSASSSRNLAASPSRMAVALPKVSAFAWIPFFNCVMEVPSSPKRALRASISEPNSMSLASASLTAFVLSFSLVSHQHTILSYLVARRNGSTQGGDRSCHQHLRCARGRGRRRRQDSAA